MQPEYRQALTKNYVLLVNETPVNEVLDELVLKKILNHEMKEFIRHHPTWKGRTRALLEILPRRGTEAFHAFCCALLFLKRDDLRSHVKAVLFFLQHKVMTIDDNVIFSRRRRLFLE